MKNIFLIPTLLLIIVLNFYPFFTHGQDTKDGTYKLLAPIPCVNGTGDPGSGDSGKSTNYTTECGKLAEETTLSKYIPGAFKLSIGLIATFAVVSLVIGGFQYMTSTAFTGKAAGLERAKSSLWALVCVLGAWAILYNINPNLLKLDLNIETIDIDEINGGVLADIVTSSPALNPTTAQNAITQSCPNCSVSGGLQYNLSEANLARFNCQNCSPITTKVSDNGRTNMNVAPNLNSALTSLNNGLSSQNVGWMVTEAFPPTVDHRDECHYNGTCIDAALTNSSPENIKRFSETAINNGLTPKYEVKTETERVNLIKQLESLGMQNAKNIVLINTSTKGAHFHLKK